MLVGHLEWATVDNLHIYIDLGQCIWAAKQQLFHLVGEGDWRSFSAHVNRMARRFDEIYRPINAVEYLDNVQIFVRSVQTANGLDEMYNDDQAVTVIHLGSLLIRLSKLDRNSKINKANSRQIWIAGNLTRIHLFQWLISYTSHCWFDPQKKRVTFAEWGTRSWLLLAFDNNEWITKSYPT